jgi:CBS domain-containing protein
MPNKGKAGPTKQTSNSENAATETLQENISLITGAVADPTFRIGRLDAAHNRPLSVKPESPLQTATTMMLMHGYSQLPVMTSEYTVKGIVSWRSIGTHQSLAGTVRAVKDCMEAAHEVSSEASVFSAIPIIIEQDYILVRDVDNRIVGIVTASDLSLQFRQLAEPFLLIGEIENHVRRLIDSRFTSHQLAKAVQPLDGRTIESVSDLSFGEYVRVFEHPDCWQKIGLKVDKVLFTKQLDRIRELRNEVMHFDPDPFEEADLITLRSFAEFLRRLAPESATT